MAQKMKEEDLELVPRWLPKDKAKLPRWHQGGMEEEHWRSPEKPKMATQRQCKIAKMRPKWHRVQAWVTSREDQDGTIEETRGHGAGTKNDIQRKSKIGKMAPNLHGVRSLGTPT